MARVHRIEPLGPPGPPGLPDWWRAPVHPRELCEVAPNRVTTSGPVLVDWDTVRVDSAALEAGRVALIFGAFGAFGGAVAEPTGGS